jgi:hypothetical protein
MPHSVPAASEVVDAIARIVIELQDPSRNSAKLLEDLETIIALHSSDVAVSEAARINSHLVAAHEFIQARWLLYESALEDRFVTEYLLGKTDALVRHVQRHAPLVRREAAIIDIQDGDFVTLLGSGSLPVTAIVYSQHFGAHCTCIDTNPGALASAQRLLDRFSDDGLLTRGSVLLVHADAGTCAVEGFSKIVVSLHCGPKKKVLNNLARAAPGTHVLVRLPVGIYRLLYPDVSLRDDGCFSVIRYNSEDRSNMIQPVLLLRNQASS